LRARAPPAALTKALRGRGGVGARVVPAAPRTRPGAATISARRELQEQAILPALQCEAGQDHPQGRFASHVMAYGHPCA